MRRESTKSRGAGYEPEKRSVTYFRQLASAVQNLHSELRDIHEVAWDDTGLVTCWLEQDYVLNNQRQHISAPTTIVLRRLGNGWRLVLAHSIPLPEDASG